MSSLSDEALQSAFVGKCLSLAPVWNERMVEQRLEVYRNAAHSIAAMVPMPAFNVRATVMVRTVARFSPRCWEMEVSDDHLDRDFDLKEFVLMSSTIYHETRHAEQFFRVLQGTAAGHFKLPVIGMERVLNPNRIKDFADAFRVPFKVATEAIFTKDQYPRAMHDTLVRGWYRSFYGFNSAYRAKTLEQAHFPGGIERYLNLPEEVDAFRMGKGVAQKLQDRWNSAAAAAERTSVESQS